MFPGTRWSEWNGRYRDEVRRFWRGDPGFVGALATRLCGSSDLYQHNHETPVNSINFITCHDGFTLNDLVSYQRKYNIANGEDNRDGMDENYSTNYGVEDRQTTLLSTCSGCGTSRTCWRRSSCRAASLCFLAVTSSVVRSEATTTPTVRITTFPGTIGPSYYRMVKSFVSSKVCSPFVLVTVCCHENNFTLRKTWTGSIRQEPLRIGALLRMSWAAGSTPTVKEAKTYVCSSTLRVIPRSSTCLLLPQ